jgi:hypothetical protein
VTDSGATNSTRNRQRLANLLGGVAGVWVIGGLVYMLWTRLSYPNLTLLGKGVVVGVCLTGIAFAISAMWPFSGQSVVPSGEMANFWSFVRGPEPEVAHKKALWRKMRRTVGIWCVLIAWMIIAIGLGLSGLLYR